MNPLLKNPEVQFEVLTIQAAPMPDWIPLQKNPEAQYTVFEIQAFAASSLKNPALQVAQVVKSKLFNF